MIQVHVEDLGAVLTPPDLDQDLDLSPPPDLNQQKHDRRCHNSF